MYKVEVVRFAAIYILCNIGELEFCMRTQSLRVHIFS